MEIYQIKEYINNCPVSDLLFSKRIDAKKEMVSQVHYYKRFYDDFKFWSPYCHVEDNETDFIVLSFSIVKKSGVKLCRLEFRKKHVW